jgi:hypothetical protein
MLRPMKVPNALLLAAAVGLLAGCAQNGTPVSAPVATTVPSVAPNPTYTPISAADACPAGAPIHLPGDVPAITRAYLCVHEFRQVPGAGEWEFSIVKGVTSGLGALLRAYLTPDAALTDGTCPAIAVTPRVIYLQGSRTLAVRAPLDACRFPTAAGNSAYEALGTVDISATKEGQVRSQGSLTSGCPDMYKDMLAIEEESGGPSHISPTPRAVDAGTVLCLYAVAPDPQGLRVGRLTSARPVAATEVGQINRALTQSTVDASCGRHQHTRFAMLQPGGQSGGPTTLVALDGCAVQQDGGWWRATDRLRALVAA